MSLYDQIEDARKALTGPVYYYYPPGASEPLEVVCAADYDALAARLEEAEIALRHVLNATGPDGLHANEYVYRFAEDGLRATDSATPRESAV